MIAAPGALDGEMRADDLDAGLVGDHLQRLAGTALRDRERDLAAGELPARRGLIAARDPARGSECQRRAVGEPDHGIVVTHDIDRGVRRSGAAQCALRDVARNQRQFIYRVAALKVASMVRETIGAAPPIAAPEPAAAQSAARQATRRITRRA